MILTGKNSGYDMTFDTGTGIYQLLDDQGAVLKESKSLEAIDRFITTGGEKKEKKKFKRINVLFVYRYGSNDGTFEKVGATSVAEPTRHDHGTYFWIIKKGKKEKVNGFSLLLDDPINHELLKKIATKQEAIEQIREEIKVLKEEFKYLTPEMMKED